MFNIGTWRLYIGIPHLQIAVAGSLSSECAVHCHLALLALLERRMVASHVCYTPRDWNLSARGFSSATEVAYPQLSWSTTQEFGAWVLQRGPLKPGLVIELFLLSSSSVST